MTVDATHYAVAKYPGPQSGVVSEEWLPGGHFRGTRWLRCDWVDRDELVEDLCMEEGGAGQLWPYDTDRLAYLTNIKVVGSGKGDFDDNGLAVYDSAVLVCTYNTLAANYASSVVAEERIEPHYRNDMIHPGVHGLRWVNASGNPIMSYVPYINCGLTYCLTFYRALSVPAAAVTYLGYCNSASWTTYTLGITFGAQTLLNRDPLPVREVRMGGVARYTVRYRWPFNPGGWNTRWNPDAGAYQAVYSTNASGTITFHPTVAFSNLVPAYV